MQNKNSIRQHTVPCSYLQFFCEDIANNKRNSLINIYDIPNKKFRKDKISNVSIQKDIYTLKSPNGTKYYRIEKFLAEYIDSSYTTINKINRKEKITQLERNKILIFLSFQFARTRFNFKQLNESEGKIIEMDIRSIYENVEQQDDRINVFHNLLKKRYSSSNLIGREKEILKNFENGEKINVKHNDECIKGMFFMSERIFHHLVNGFNTNVFFTEKCKFICSDNPVGVKGNSDGPYGLGFIDMKLITFPLSMNSALIFTRKEITEGNLTHKKMIKYYDLDESESDNQILNYINILTSQNSTILMTGKVRHLMHFIKNNFR